MDDKLTYDKDGFALLIPRETSSKTKKASRNPFKKGSWKAWLYKKLNKWHSSKYVLDFHYNHAENVIIQRKDKPKTILLSNRPNDDLIKKLESKKYKDALILIDCGEGIYTKISSKCYRKLMSIDKIAINVSLKGQEDGENEYFDVFDDDKVYDNINAFLSWVNYYRQLVNGVGEVQCHCCWFTYIKYTCKTVIKFRDGTVKSYKGDFNEVLSEFDFDPLL